MVVGTTSNGKGLFWARSGIALSVPNGQGLHFLKAMTRPPSGILPGGIAVGQAQFQPDADTASWQLFVLAGQSNNISGLAAALGPYRVPNPSVGMVMISPTDTQYANKIVKAVEPLTNETQTGNDPNKIGYGRSFADNYVLYVDPDAKILLATVAVGGTGFSSPDTVPNWNPDHPNNLYNGGVNAWLAFVQRILTAYPQTYLAGTLWDQGEEDYLMTWAGPGNLLEIWINFFTRMRTDINTPDLPIVVTTLSPAVPTFTLRSADIANFSNQLAFVGVADDRAGGQSGWGDDTGSGALGFFDEPPVYADDPTHFSADTQWRFRGPRIAKAFTRAIVNNNPGGTLASVNVPGKLTDLALSQAKDGYVILSFTPPSLGGSPSNGGGAILGYDTRLSTDGGVTWFDAPLALGTMRRLAGLTNDQFYSCQVRARNFAGPGPWSDTITFTPIPINLNAALTHRLVPGASSVTDTASAATILANSLTFGNDGEPYVILNSSTSRSGVGAGSFHSQAQTLSAWVYVTAIATNRGIISEWSSSTKRMAFYVLNSGSGFIQLRGGPSTNTAELSCSMTDPGDLNRWVHVAITIGDDGLGAGTYRWRAYIDGVLKKTTTGVAARTLGDSWHTGFADISPFNSIAHRRAVTRIYSEEKDQDFITALYEAGRSA